MNYLYDIAEEPKPVAGERDEVFKARQEAYRLGYSKEQPYATDPLLDKDFDNLVTQWLPKDPTKSELESIHKAFFDGRWNKMARKRNWVRFGIGGAVVLTAGYGIAYGFGRLLDKL